jgi:hypothetical protein
MGSSKPDTLFGDVDSALLERTDVWRMVGSFRTPRKPSRLSVVTLEKYESNAVIIKNN